MTAATVAQAATTRNLGGVKRFLMKASTTIYAGALVMINTSGTAEPAADGSTARAVVGIATETVTSAASGSYWINVQEGEILGVGTTLGQADVGLMHYMTDDLTFDDVPGLNSLAVGPMVEYIGAASGWFYSSWKHLPALVQKKTRFPLTIWSHLLSEIADGDLMTDWTAGFLGEIVGLMAITNKVASTASKTTAIHAEIGATATTGGVLTLTTAGCNAMGEVTASTAITAGSVFGAADTLSVLAASTTAFVEGEVTINLILDQFFGA